MWLWDGFSVLAKALNMQFDRLANERNRFFVRLTNCHAPRKIRHIRAEGCIALLNNHDVFHGLAYFFFKPACFQMLASVPTGTSTLGLPATVTVPGFVGCLNWR